MQPHHFSSQTEHRQNFRNNDLQHQLDLALKNLVRWKCRFKGIKKFLLAKGVPPEYFEEYNAQFGEGESKAKV